MGRTILITGANRGIGLGLTQNFLAKDDRVIATTRNPDKSPELKALAKEYPDTCIIETLDVKSDVSVAGLAAKIQSLGQLDILINNAGVLDAKDRSFDQVELDVLADTLAVNSIAPIRVTRKLLPTLMKSKQPTVVSITSRMGSIEENTGGGYYAYRMSKAALNMFNKSFSVDFPKIIAVVIHPGWVKTDMGGKEAPLKVDDACPDIVKIVDRLQPRDTGKFFDYAGGEIRW